MDRLQIINKFIQERGYRIFLNVGVFTGYTLDGVSAKEKIGVDPEPHHYKGKEFVYPVTSDSFFESLSGDVKFDVAFIDGLHEYQTVYRDIQNSLKHLSEGGVIILHDLNPPTLEHVTTGDKFGNWNGDCYRAFLKFRSEDYIGFAEKYECFVVDTDWGVGVIQEKKDKRMKSIEKFDKDQEFYQKGIDNWEYFDQNRKELLNLISVEEFLKKFEKSSTTTLSYTGKTHWEMYDKEHGTNKVEEIYEHLNNDLPAIDGEEFTVHLPGKFGLYIAGVDPYHKEGDSIKTEKDDITGL